jgi:hypothetical protein
MRRKLEPVVAVGATRDETAAPKSEKFLACGVDQPLP